MKRSPLRKVLFLIPILLLILAVSSLAIKRVEDLAREKAELKSRETPPLPVRCIRASLGPIHALVFGEGTARAVRREYLTFENQGKITYVKETGDGQSVREGDRVRGPGEGGKFGELLASLDKREHVEQLEVSKSSLVESQQQVEVARAQIAEAESQENLAADNLKRHEKLFNAKAISQHELDIARANFKTAGSTVRSAQARLQAALSGVNASRARMKQSQLPMERSSIYAPFDGVLAYVNIKKGDYFAPGLVNTSSEEALLRTIPMVLIDPTRFEVTMELPYFDGFLVKPGQRAIIMAAAGITPSPSELEESSPLQNNAVRGTVFSVSPAISPGGRSIQVKIRTGKRVEGIWDGMFVVCWIIVEEKEKAVTVPFDVFVYRQNKPYVFVVDESRGIVEQRQVVEGIAGLFKEEIVEGVLEGTLLVTDGRHRLSDGAPVEVIEVAGETEK